MRIMRKQLWKGFSKGEMEQLPEALAPSGKFSWEKQSEAEDQQQPYHGHCTGDWDVWG